MGSKIGRINKELERKIEIFQNNFNSNSKKKIKRTQAQGIIAQLFNPDILNDYEIILDKRGSIKIRRIKR